MENWSMFRSTFQQWNERKRERFETAFICRMKLMHFLSFVSKSKFLNIMNALVEIKSTQFPNEGQMWLERLKQLNTLSYPTLKK